MFEEKNRRKEKQMARITARSFMGVLHNNSESHQRNAILYGLWNEGRHPSSSHNYAEFIYQKADHPIKCKDFKTDLNFVDERRECTQVQLVAYQQQIWLC